ncbi:redoxin domain-containing protein [Maribacter sp. 2307ULW6-5]|uniref:redoxin domain-containing protein n=1 Tax=Maribacter sp. 2307ULW6-5 TaxID=3386275 RepID=UPI0039BD4B46
MKLILILLTLVYSVSSFSQLEFYTTNGKNRLTKTELEHLLRERQEKLADKLKGMGLVTNTTKTEKSKDSIIHYVNFGVKGAASFNNNFSTFLNKPFPDFRLMSLEGVEVSMDKFKGKPTMINFWFTSCAPCIAEMPVLNKMKEQFGADFNFVSLTYESQEKVEGFLKKQPFNFEHIINARSFIDAMKINTYPINFFIDKDGIVREVKYGIPKRKGVNGKIAMGDGDKFIETLQTLL